MSEYVKLKSAILLFTQLSIVPRFHMKITNDSLVKDNFLKELIGNWKDFLKINFKKKRAGRKKKEK